MKMSAANSSAWALGEQKRNGFHVRRIVWGLFMAKAERREGEEIRAATILIAPKPKAKAKANKPKAKREPALSYATQLDLRRNDLKYFDLLPEKLRRVVNEACFKCTSDVLYRMWHDNGMTCKQVIQQLKRDQDDFLRERASS